MLDIDVRPFLYDGLVIPSIGTHHHAPYARLRRAEALHRA